MLKYIVKREIKNIFYGYVFQISFLLIIAVFIVGTITYLKSYDSRIQEHSKYHSEFIDDLKKDAERNLTELAIKRQKFVLRPRHTGFIANCKEKYFPNAFIHSAFYVFGFEVTSSSVNLFLSKFHELDWLFIVSLIVSFVALLLTFNTISGEKELGTLALTLSNPISRGVLLLGKYISVIVSTMLMLIIGIIISLLIVIISHKVSISYINMIEIMGFLLASFFFISLISAFGILTSVIVRSSSVSLLFSLTFWLVFVVVIPNSSVFLAKNIFYIEKSETINRKIREAQADIGRNAPEGSGFANPSDPFNPKHKLRAVRVTNEMNAEMNIKNSYCQDMFRQFEKTRFLTIISPVSLFECLCEAVVGGGYLRFQNVWEDLHNFQSQFLTFFKAKDANDPDSPHWYNPRDQLSTTRKPINFKEVPLFEEKTISLAERFSFILKYLLVIVIYTAVIFFSSFVLFVRYDVR